ncbi:MAG: transporter [Wenzhouxiangellaceae bacterium]|nr:transporter [Wenzhouxiangellaceae bacterium]
MALIMCLGLLPRPAESAAWTRPEGSALLSFPVTYSTADEAFDEDGDRQDVPEFDLIEISPFFEYGLLDSLTFGLQPKYRFVEVETEEGDDVSNDGLAEVDVSLRKRLWGEGDAAFSFQTLVKVPLRSNEGDPAALGRDQYDVDLSLLYGNRHRMSAGTLFYNVDFGYRFRAEEPDDQVHADAFLGWSQSRWTFMVTSSNSIGVDEPEVDSDVVLTGRRTFTRLTAGLVASYRITNNFGISANASRVWKGEGIGVIQSAGLSLFAIW